MNLVEWYGICRERTLSSILKKLIRIHLVCFFYNPRAYIKADGFLFAYCLTQQPNMPVQPDTSSIEFTHISLSNVLETSYDEQRG